MNAHTRTITVNPYDYKFRSDRAALLNKPNVQCVHCGSLEVTVADHQPPLAMHRHIKGSGCCVIVPSCMPCSRDQGGALGAAMSSVPKLYDEVPDPIGFDVTDAVWDAPWLDALREVPDNGTWPRLMSPPHPQAVDSYGDEAAHWLEENEVTTLRWWQRLALTRMLEHDEDGALCWLVVALTCSRQSGKSTLLRAMALWRLHQSQRFGEPQTILHTGKDLSICNEVQRVARGWGRERGYRCLEGNGKEQIEDVESGSRWLVRGRHAVYGYAATLALVDEAFGVAQDVVDDGVEPTMIERHSPQLLLASTANRRATALFTSRRASVLSDLSAPQDTLLVEWSAKRGATIDDREAWRQASPYWSKQRQRLLENRLRRVESGETVDVDEADPRESFSSQYLNIWPATIVPVGAGAPLWSDLRVWQACQRPVRAAQEPLGRRWVAVEDHYGTGAAVAAVAVSGDRYEVDAWLCDSLEDALVSARLCCEMSGDAPAKLIVGASFANRVRGATSAGAQETRYGLPLLRALVLGGKIVRDETPELDAQIAEARVREVSGGLNLVPGKRSDLIRALCWGLREACAPKPSPAIA